MQSNQYYAIPHKNTTKTTQQHTVARLTLHLRVQLYMLTHQAVVDLMAQMLHSSAPSVLGKHHRVSKIRLAPHLWYISWACGPGHVVLGV